MPLANPTVVWASILFLLLAAGASIPLLNDDALYLDERFTIMHIGDMQTVYSPAQTAQSVANNSEQHAPGYFWLLGGWAVLVGYSQVALRYLSVLAGVLSLAMMYRLGHRLFGCTTGLVAMGLLAASALHTYFFHEMRMYTLYTLLMLLLLWGYQQVIEAAHPRPWQWGVLGGAAVGLLYTHYFAILTLSGLGVHHLLFVRKDRRWWWVAGTLVLAVLTFLPWLGVVLAGTAEVLEETRRGLAVPDALWLMGWVVANGNPLLIGIAGLGLLWHARSRPARLLLTIGGVSLVGLLAANELLDLLPPRRARYLLIVLPHLLLPLAAGLVRVPDARVTLTLLLSGWFVAGNQLLANPLLDLYTNREQLQQADYPPFSEVLVAFQREGTPRTVGERLLAVSTTSTKLGQVQNFIGEYYLRQLGMDGQVIVLEDPPEAVLNAPVIYLGYDPARVPPTAHDRLVRSLLPRYDTCAPIADQPDLALAVYVQPNLPCPDQMQSQRVSFGRGRVRLLGHATQQTSDELVVVTTWAASPNAANYSYSLRVVDETGAYLAMRDAGVPSTEPMFGAPTPPSIRTEARFSTAGWPPGPYALRLVVYNWATGERLAAPEVGVGEISLQP